MMRTEAKSILARAFAALSPREGANLRWHAAEGTPILCGQEAFLYVKNGGG